MKSIIGSWSAVGRLATLVVATACVPVPPSAPPTLRIVFDREHSPRQSVPYAEPICVHVWIDCAPGTHGGSVVRVQPRPDRICEEGFNDWMRVDQGVVEVPIPPECQRATAIEAYVSAVPSLACDPIRDRLAFISMAAEVREARMVLSCPAASASAPGGE